jgi:hypothetical protein
MSEEEIKSRASQEISVQYVSDGQGNVQNVLVPIDLWRKLIMLYEASNLPADTKQTDAAAGAPSTMFGAFPALAAIEFEEQFDAVKQLGRESIERQLDSIQGHE